MTEVLGTNAAANDEDGGVDLRRMRSYRLTRLRTELAKADFGGCVLFDPNNIRYATDSRNMHIYTLRWPFRYVFIPTTGPVTLFEYFGSEHLSQHLETIDEIRPAQAWDYPSAAEHVDARIARFAKEINDLMLGEARGNRRIALDRLDSRVVQALTSHGMEVFPVDKASEMARQIKSTDELACMRRGVEVTQTGLTRMKSALQVGVSENELWSILHQTNIELGGEWIETRLLSSGQRTNPWFQESSEKRIREGDLVAIDTDLFGPFGYGCDMSRTWACASKPTALQRELYQLAHENVHFNMELIKPGVSFRELVEKSWQMPEKYLPQRYSKIAHGAGVGFEYPNIPYREDWDSYGFDGMIEKDMVFCIESYIGEPDGSQGVKLEQQVLVTDCGVEVLSDFPFEEEMLTF